MKAIDFLIEVIAAIAKDTPAYREHPRILYTKKERIPDPDEDREHTEPSEMSNPTQPAHPEISIMSGLLAEPEILKTAVILAQPEDLLPKLTEEEKSNVRHEVETRLANAIRKEVRRRERTLKIRDWAKKITPTRESSPPRQPGNQSLKR